MSADLSTRYLGLSLRNPIVASAGPLTGDLDTLCQLEQAGVAAAVLPSLFEEQITRDQQRVHAFYEIHAEGFGEALSFFPDLQDRQAGPAQCLKILEEAKRSVAIPIIASLNGCSPGGWLRYAKLFQEAGADAVELNIYFVPTDPRLTSHDVESQYVELVAAVREVVTIPVAVKLGAQFTNLANFIPRLVSAGADGVVLFNRYLEPDIDLESLKITPQLVLSYRHELRLPLRWIAILRDQVSISIAATTGIHESHDAIKALLVGADACMLTSALLKRGVDYAAVLIQEIQHWLDLNDYASLEQLKGSMSYGNCPDAGALERANYMKAIASYTAAH
jgi:dihydroorotate dehydrogenase (fumarate)